jgi:catechol 2,3-dioxygenase-like lactoylglutathione lyase family enzyme
MLNLPMPGRRIQHVDLAVSDVDRSLTFYLDLLEPLGMMEEERYPTYRGTEDVVYLSFGDEWLGLRPADDGTHRYDGVGLEHLAFEVDTKEEVDGAHQRCSRRGDRIHHPPEEDSDIPGYYAFFVFDPDGLRIEVFSSGRSDPRASIGRLRRVFSRASKARQRVERRRRDRDPRRGLLLARAGTAAPPRRGHLHPGRIYGWQERQPDR